MHGIRQSMGMIVIATVTLLSCWQGSRATSESIGQETANSVRKYTYADGSGKLLVIDNSVPRGGGYIGPDGKRYPYTVYYTRITNGTSSPVELDLNFPADSFAFPQSSANYMRIFLPQDTMTPDKISEMDYGLTMKAFLDHRFRQPHSLKRTIHPNDSSAFYVVLFSETGVGGALRTGLSQRGGELFYKIAAYKSAPGLPLLEEKELRCGSISPGNLVLRK